MAHSASEGASPVSSRLKLAFASIGVVFGDIGTSPLYAMREALHPVVKAGADLHTAVLGVCSLLIWALFLIVTVKYVILLMRADNKGEGGILSLVGLVESILNKRGGLVLVLGIVGAAFFFGDAMITPAMTVLSAIEGLEVINPQFAEIVLPATLAVLITLFLFQYHGTAGVASLFAPITGIWFLVIGTMGVVHLSDNLGIFASFNPYYAVETLVQRPGLALMVFGGVFLSVTGGEALYADMGHFGRNPIRIAWLGCVFPGVVLNYLGQGAFIIAHPEGIGNPIFTMVPSWGLIPFVILATAVSVIASQAVITGAFSMAQQAIALGLLPRMNIVHTSETEQGQIYIAQINFMVMIGVILLVLVFKSSSNLASAYGVAVNTSMAIDSLLGIIFFWKTASLPRPIVLPLLVAVLLIELTFLAANALKIVSGGYMPILIGMTIILLMVTWMKGRKLLMHRLRTDSIELDGLLQSLERRPPARVAGAAVFLQTDPQFAPSALMHNLKHNRVLHDTLVFVFAETLLEPRVEDEGDRVSVKRLALGAWLVHAKFGYMEQPDVPLALRACEPLGLAIDPRQASYFLGRRVILTSDKSSMPMWQQRIFIVLTNQSARAIDFFRIPPDRVVELGMQLSV